MPQTAPNPVQQAINEPVDKPRPTATAGSDTANEATCSPEKKSESGSSHETQFSAIALMGESAKFAGKLSDGFLRGLGIASNDEMLPKTDTASMTPVEKAAKGFDSAAVNEKLFMEMKGPYQQKTFSQGEFKNFKNASVQLNDKGQVTDFETAPPASKDTGFKYSNIKYDDKGAIKSFDTPWGTTHTRVGDVNKDGYGKWQATNKQGQPVIYSGAESSTWFGKTVVDEKGVHNIVASGPKQWNMYSRSPDGTYTETDPRVENGKLKGFQTTTILDDNTKISSKSHFEKGEIVRDLSVDITDNRGGKGSVELDDSKKDGKFVSAAERKKMEAFGSMLDFDKNPMFNHVNSFSLNRQGNNLNFAADLDRPLDTPPPNVRVTGLGPFGGASAVPISSRINDPSGTIVTHPENPGQVDIVNMRGFTGESQAYGPRGRARGVHSSSTDSMTMYSDQNGNGHLIARSEKANVNLTARNMRGGMFGDVLADPAKKQDFTDGLAKIRDNLDSLEFKKDAKGNLQGSFDPRASEIALNKKLADSASQLVGAEATNLYFNDGKLKFDIQNTAQGKDFNFKKGDLQVGIKTALTPEVKLSISKLVTCKDAHGKPHVEVEFYGREGRTKLF
ncbi:MAG: hypothetical protein IT342_18785 [Candidatus Melainabacteria bacterium]|nr:hypothetical protein [Candidatus Melainabacteria bacterium]